MVIPMRRGMNCRAWRQSQRSIGARSILICQIRAKIVRIINARIMRKPRLVCSPALKLIGVLAVAIGLQSALGLALGGVLIGWVLLRHRPRFMKLLRRLRLLILVLFGVTLLMTPGAALFPEWGLYPTAEGVHLAVTQLIHLLGMLAVVTLLLDSTDQRALAAGTLALLQPLAGSTQWPERAVARLLLVFEYLESAPPPRNLQEVLALAGMEKTVAGAFAEALDMPEMIELPDAALTRQDVVLGTGLLTLSVLALSVGRVG